MALTEEKLREVYWRMPEVEILPAPQPMKSMKYSEQTRLPIPVKGEPLPPALIETADEISRLSAQGLNFASIAGRLRLFPEELRELFLKFPDLHRAMLFGNGVGVEHVTAKLQDNINAGSDRAIELYLKARGGFEKEKAGGGSVTMKSGDVSVSVDLDDLREMTGGQKKAISAPDELC